MFRYYLNLALRSFRRNRALTALMVLAIALGIGASMTTLTVFHVLSGDPIPQKSDRLFYVQLDPQPSSGFKPGDEPTDQLNRFDAEELLRQRKAFRNGVDSNHAFRAEQEGRLDGEETDGAAAEDGDRLALLDVAVLRRHVACGKDIRQEEHLLVREAVRDLDRADVGIRHAQVLRLTAGKPAVEF